MLGWPWFLLLDFQGFALVSIVFLSPVIIMTHSPPLGDIPHTWAILQPGHWEEIDGLGISNQFGGSASW